MKILCHFSKAAITSRNPYCATVQMAGNQTLWNTGNFWIDNAETGWSICTIDSLFLLGLWLALVLKNHVVPSGKHQVKTPNPKIFLLCSLITKQIEGLYFCPQSHKLTSVVWWIIHAPSTSVTLIPFCLGHTTSFSVGFEYHPSISIENFMNCHWWPAGI